MLFGEFPLTQNLSAVSNELRRRHIVHRFTEEEGAQRLWIENAADADEVLDVIHNIALSPSESPVVEQNGASVNWGILFRRVPFTLLIILLGLFGFALVAFEFHRVAEGLLFSPLDHMVASGQLWRLLTPAFIHFSIVHIVFNALWVWEVGKRLEIFLGVGHYLGIFLSSALLANLLQYAFSENLVFGGLSGVVYGYFGGAFVLSRYWLSPVLRLPPGIYVFMLVWLALGFLGWVDFFISGSIANWAHLGGLLGGVFYALLYIVFNSKRTV